LKSLSNSSIIRSSNNIKMPSKKKKTPSPILPPKENETFGEWSSEIIRKALLFHSDHKCLLSNSLNVLTNDLNMEPSHVLDEKIGDLAPDGAVKDRQDKQRFVVDIGFLRLHEENFVNRPIAVTKDGGPKKPINFKEWICNFYGYNFSPSERSHITKSVGSAWLVHVVVYNTFHENIKRNDDSKKRFVYEIAAAASFFLGNQSSCLVYLSTSLGHFYKTPEYDPDVSGNRRGKPRMRPYRKEQLGRLLVCMVQKLTFLLIGQYNIVCQSANEYIDGSIFFYLKNFFQIVSIADPLVEEHHKLHKHFQDADNTFLVYVVVNCPIYLVFPWWIKRTVMYEPESMRIAI
jgi:hypothetical protein